MRQDTSYVSAIHSWAATTQNIVEASRLYTRTFARLASDHHERFHTITIDFLCLAFHSIAYRGQDNIYVTMIGPSAESKQLEPLIRIYRSDSTDTEESASDDDSNDDGTSIQDHSSSGSEVDGLGDDSVPVQSNNDQLLQQPTCSSGSSGHSRNTGVERSEGSPDRGHTSSGPDDGDCEDLVTAQTEDDVDDDSVLTEFEDDSGDAS